MWDDRPASDAYVQLWKCFISFGRVWVNCECVVSFSVQFVLKRFLWTVQERSGLSDGLVNPSCRCVITRTLSCDLNSFLVKIAAQFSFLCDWKQLYMLLICDYCSKLVLASPMVLSLHHCWHNCPALKNIIQLGFFHNIVTFKKTTFKKAWFKKTCKVQMFL